MMPTRRDFLIGLSFVLALAASFTVDQPVARLMAGNDAHVVAMSQFISWFGQGAVVLVPAGLITLAAIGLRFARPAAATRADPVIARSAVIFATVAAAGIANDLLKVVFGRARPVLWLSGDDSGFGFFRYGAKVASFPSGHTATSVAAAIVLSALFPRWRPELTLFACLIAISRVAGGAHYPSDVIAGALVGGAVALAIVRQTGIRGLLYPPRQPGDAPQESELAAVESKGNNH